MPRLLLRFMLGDVLRMAVLTCSVLLVIISFGAAIKPLSNNSLLTAGQTIKYITLAMIPMLQYALPFAAGFAGTMSLHRMAVCNEVLAAAASGISYRRLLLPVVVIGLGLGAVMLLLTNSVIPRFWTMLSQTLAADAARLFQITIERGEPFIYGDLEICADAVHEIRNPEGSAAQTRLVLARVAVAITDDDGLIDQDVTARQAVFDIERADGVTILRMSLSDVVAYQHETGTLARTPRIEPRPQVILSAMRADPKSMTRSQLAALYENPDNYGPVVSIRHALIEAIWSSELLERINQSLTESGRLELNGDSPPRHIVIYGSGLSGSTVKGNVRVEQYDNGVMTHTIRAATVEIRRRPAGLLGAVTVDLVLSDYEVTDAVTGTTNRRAHVSIEDLAFDALADADLHELTSPELIRRAAASPAAPKLKEPRERLVRKITSLRNEITGRVIRRIALSCTAPLLLVLGATLAMWLRHSLPLTIYLLAFLPSIANLILIEGGLSTMRDGNMLMGLLVMWSGNAVLLVMWVFSLYRLSRN